MVTKPNDVELILVGDELLKGERRDAHLPVIARAFLTLGVRIARVHTVGDETDRIADVAREAITRARVVITTGGLGPTADDITRIGVAQALDVPLEFNEDTWQEITAFFASRGFAATDNNRQQAMFPRGAVILGNAQGTAPGFVVDRDDVTVFTLPGPPRELRPMLDAHVLPRVAALFKRPPVRVETYRTIGVGESQLVTQFDSALKATTAYHVSYLPSLTGVEIVLTARTTADDASLNREATALADALRAGLGSKLYEHGTRSLGRVVHDTLITRGETLGIAESFTGGLIGDQLVTFPGASRYLQADVVSYADTAKHTLLGVREETLKQFGAASEETCIEMAHGIRNRVAATWGIATTGIAGPDGGTLKKPVGLCYLGVAWDGGSSIKRMQYRGERQVIRERAVAGVLWMLLDRVQR